MAEMSLDDYFKNDEGKSSPGKKSKKKMFRARKVKNKKTKPRKEEEQQSKPLYPEEEYPTVYKNLTWIRGVVWAVLLILVVRGIVAFVKPPRPVINEIKYMQSLSESDMVKAFAEQFVKEYLTYTSKDQGDYKNRLQKYTSNMISANNVIGWSEVLEANVWQLRKIDDNNAVVVIHAVVRQGKEYDTVNIVNPGLVDQSQNPAQQPTTMKNTANNIEYKEELYIKVPVKVIKESSFVVTDYPVFIEPFEVVNDYYNDDTQTLEAASDNVRTEIKTLMDNFFQIYDDGTSDQISYYMLDSQKMRGFEGKYIYKRIVTYEVYKLNNVEDEVIADVQIETNDKLGTSFNQKFRFILKKKKADKELRWYIERFIEPGETIN